LYELARQGQEVPREPRWVEIYDIQLVRWEFPRALFDVCCSKGTYIRTLCADVGELLHAGAHLSFLIRTRSGSFRLDEACTLENINTAVSRGEYSFLQAMETLVSHFPAIQVKASSVERVLYGNPLKLSDLTSPVTGLKEGEWVQVRSPAGRLLAMGQMAGAGPAAICYPKIVFGT